MFRIIKRIMNWTGNRKKRLYVGFIYSFLNTMFSAMLIMGAYYALDMIVKDVKGEIKLDSNLSWQMLLFMIAVIFGRFLFAYLRAVSQESIGYEITADQRIEIGDILKRVSLGFFKKNNTGEIASAITTDLSFVEMFGMKMIDTVINGYISAFTMVLFLAYYNIYVALIAVAGIVFSMLSLRLMSKKSRKNAPSHQKAQDRMIAATIEYIRGIPVVKAFKQIGAARDGIGKAYKYSKDLNIRVEKDYVPCNCLHLFSLKAASVAIVLSSAIFTLNGQMEISTMFMMMIFSFVIFGHVEQINNATHVLEIIDATLNKLNGIEKAEFIDEDGKDIEFKKFDIKFKNVSFAYENDVVLKNVNIKIPENSTTAVVGPSGSGKTTLCNLIARFYDVNEGSISIGGTDIRKATCDSLLKNISMVFQKVYLFHDSIINNIRFGKPDAKQDEVMEAAKKARCHDFIMQLPNGYDTIIGEGGSTLSGGEKQRISIARAMLKNAPIIILDEATASVDPENEHYIQKAIDELTKGKTVITIAHRLATIQNSDNIIVLDNGEVVQSGTHEKLISQDGVYGRFLDIRQTAEGWVI